MFSRFVHRQSSYHHLSARYMIGALIALACPALIALGSFNNEPVTAWSQPAPATEPNIIWPAADTGEANGLTRYEISTDSSPEIQTPIRFVF